MLQFKYWGVVFKVSLQQMMSQLYMFTDFSEWGWDLVVRWSHFLSILSQTWESLLFLKWCSQTFRVICLDIVRKKKWRVTEVINSKSVSLMCNKFCELMRKLFNLFDWCTISSSCRYLTALSSCLMTLTAVSLNMSDINDCHWYNAS